MAEDRTEQLRDEIAALIRRSEELAKLTREVQQRADALSRKLSVMTQLADAATERAKKRR